MKFPKRMDRFSYELKSPSELASVHPVFRDAMLKNCISIPEFILSIEGLGSQ